MDLNEDDNLLFLLSGSCNALPNSYNKLRSYLNIHSANVAEQLNLKLPKCFNNRNLTCPFCYLPWNCTPSSFKLLPTKKLTADQKRKIKSDTSRGEVEIIESSQSKNKLVLKCRICGNKTSFSLRKKSKKSDVETKVDIKVIKKKKKKEKLCGLKIEFINSKNDTKSHLTIFSANPKNKISLNNSSTIKKTPYLSIKNSVKSNMLALNKNTSKIEPIKKLIINPYAIQNQHKISKKNKKKLLSQAVKEDKGSIRNTLKEFLSLVSR